MIMFFECGYSDEHDATYIEQAGKLAARKERRRKQRKAAALKEKRRRESVAHLSTISGLPSVTKATMSAVAMDAKYAKRIESWHYGKNSRHSNSLSVQRQLMSAGDKLAGCETEQDDPYQLESLLLEQTDDGSGTKKVVINSCYGGFGLSDAAANILETDYDTIERDDKRLVKLMELRGTDFCSSNYSRLKVVEVDASYGFDIQEYDGWESIVRTPKAETVRRFVADNDADGLLEYLSRCVKLD